jgi:hypothetical protein
MWYTITCAFAALLNICLRKVSFLLNQTLSQRKAGCSPALKAVIISCIISLLFTIQKKTWFPLFQEKCIISIFLRAKAILCSASQLRIPLTSLTNSLTFLFNNFKAWYKYTSSAYLKQSVLFWLSSFAKYSIYSTKDSGEPCKVLYLAR